MPQGHKVYVADKLLEQTDLFELTANGYFL